LRLCGEAQVLGLNPKNPGTVPEFYAKTQPGQLSLSHSAPTKTAKLIESFVTTWNLIQKQSLPFLT
jgi:hypothetical protein